MHDTCYAVNTAGSRLRELDIKQHLGLLTFLSALDTSLATLMLENLSLCQDIHDRYHAIKVRISISQTSNRYGSRTD